MTTAARVAEVVTPYPARAAGAGPNHRPGLHRPGAGHPAVLRLQLPHAALAALYRVSRPTITRAVHEIRPLSARRGFAVPDRPGVRLRTLADVFAYADTEGVDLRIDGTEVQVRRLLAGRPGRQHDQTAMRTEGIARDGSLPLFATCNLHRGPRWNRTNRPTPRRCLPAPRRTGQPGHGPAGGPRRGAGIGERFWAGSGGLRATLAWRAGRAAGRRGRGSGRGRGSPALMRIPNLAEQADTVDCDLPDGTVVSVGAARHRVPEMLFIDARLLSACFAGSGRR